MAAVPSVSAAGVEYSAKVLLTRPTAGCWGAVHIRLAPALYSVPDPTRLVRL